MIENVQIAVFIVTALGATAIAWHTMKRRGSSTTTGFVLLLATIAIIGSGLVLAVRSGEAVREQLRAQIVGFAPTYADEFARRGASSIDLHTPPDDPVFLELIETQIRWLRTNPAVSDIYTFRVVDGECRLIVDSETDYNRNGVYDGEREARTRIGESFGKAEEPEQRAMNGEYTFTNEIYTDRWGTWVSAYAPIFDEDGNVHSVLGVDFPAHRWVSKIATAQRTELGIFLFIHLVIVGAAAGMRIRGEALDRARVINHDLREAMQRAEQASTAKSEFLANMSHEIRTPMNAILGYTEILLESEADAQTRNGLLIIRRNASHLLALINDILDLSRIEAGRQTFQPVCFDLRSLLNDIDQLMRVRIEEKGLELRIDWPDDAPGFVVTDPDRVRQILINLVGNSAKFTHEGHIAIRVRFSGPVADEEGRQGFLVISVEDTGIGMTPDQLERVFNPFEQADNSTTRTYGGTGLGLAICTRLAERLGGTIMAQSAAGEGSTFHLRIPTLQANEAIRDERENAQPHDAPSPTAADQAAPLTGLRVLYAEDGPDNQRLLSHHLTKAGATVELVENGQLAVERIRASPSAYDLIFMDMSMPVLDGYEATAQLRAAGCTLPIIALTAHAMDGDREHCLNAGCSDYAPKPVKRATLLELCNTWRNREHTGARRAA